MSAKGKQTEDGKQVRLEDGRLLGYLEQGDPAGKPVILCHGNPGSRNLVHPDPSIASSLGLRVISVDRPGFGLSDYQPGRRVLDWPNDVARLADALNIERFAVLGSSAGGPFAMACAVAMPERVTVLALVSSMGDMGARGAKRGMNTQLKVLFTLGRLLPWHFLRLPMGQLATLSRKDMPGLVKRTLAAFPPADVRAYETIPGMREMMETAYREMFRSGGRGSALDLALALKPWGFRASDVRVPVQFWHGEEDTNVSMAQAQALAAELPDCRTTYVPSAGHFLIFSRWREILNGLA
jgi:pimeloyl-ACP methyl ester carboxylesterase